MADTLKNEVSELAESVLAGTEFFLVDVEIKGNKASEVWIYVDGDKRGVNMDECAEISNELGFLMDAHELLNGTYRLNVSSPGLSRPLTDRRQYPKNKGRKVKIKYKDEDGYHKMQGILENLNDQKIVVKKDDGKPAELMFDQIVETKIVPSLN